MTITMLKLVYLKTRLVMVQTKNMLASPQTLSPFLGWSLGTRLALSSVSANATVGTVDWYGYNGQQRDTIYDVHGP